MKYGVEIAPNAYTGSGRVWGSGDNEIVFNELMSAKSCNEANSRFIGALESLFYNPLYPEQALSFFD